jgi:hypothetical protein
LAGMARRIIVFPIQANNTLVYPLNRSDSPTTI